MDYIVRDTSGLEWLNPLVFLIVIATAAVWLRLGPLERRIEKKIELTPKQEETRRKLQTPSIVLLVASTVGVISAFIFVPMFQWAGTTDEQNEQLQAETEEYYGLTLDRTDHYWLRYPEERPEVDFKAYGSVSNTSLSAEGEIVSRSITLVWTEGKMIFASEDERGVLQPLEPKG